MKGIVFTGNRTVELQEFPDPSPGPHDVILEMKASGICGSDLHLYRAESPAEVIKTVGLPFTGPAIGGHEPCGVVVEVGSSVSPEQAWVGQRAMNHHYFGCGVCPHCSTGWEQMCVQGVTEQYGANAHGGHAQYLRVPARTLVTMRDETPYATGAAIACGTGTAWGALKRVELSGDQTIAIFGQGPVGLSATQLAVALGARVIALDVSGERLTLAKTFGAHDVINPNDTDAVQAIRELTHGLGAHASLDASSSPEARRQAVQCVRTWGTACFVGEGGTVELSVSPDMLRRQVTVIGSWTFSKVGMKECNDFIADRGIDVEQLFTHRWDLEQGEEAYQVFDRQTEGKGVFLMN